MWLDKPKSIPQIKDAPPVVRLQNVFPGSCVSYKVNQLGAVAQLDKHIKMVFFHGKPMPHEVKELEWMKTHWNMT